METKKYNGCKNWETWNTMLHVNNENIIGNIKGWWVENFKEGYFKTDKPTPTDLKEQIKWNFHEYNFGGMVEDGLSIEDSNIDWKEITDHILEDWESYESYY